MAREFWSNVGVDIETALATALSIVSISKANPGVVTYTGTDPTTGNYVVLDVAGMVELDGRVVRAANVNAGGNTFELEGIDTTNFETFVSGSAQVVTFGASMTNAQDVDASGGEPEFADVTTIHDNIRKRVPVLVSPMSLKFGALFDPADAAMIEMATATAEITPRCVKLRFSGGSKMVFQAYVSAAGVPTGSAQGPVTTNVSFEAQGLPTVYST